LPHALNSTGMIFAHGTHKQSFIREKNFLTQQNYIREASTSASVISGSVAPT